MKRYIGVDLHTTQITVCYLTEKDEVSIRKYQLCEIEKFVMSLQKTDEIAVEATGNTRWFCEQVQKKAAQVRIVNPRGFEVIRESKTRTDHEIRKQDGADNFSAMHVGSDQIQSIFERVLRADQEKKRTRKGKDRDGS